MEVEREQYIFFLLLFAQLPNLNSPDCWKYQENESDDGKTKRSQSAKHNSDLQNKWKNASRFRTLEAFFQS